MIAEIHGVAVSWKTVVSTHRGPLVSETDTAQSEDRLARGPHTQWRPARLVDEGARVSAHRPSWAARLDAYGSAPVNLVQSAHFLFFFVFFSLYF